MDPQETWQSLLRSWEQRDWQNIYDLTEALLNWLHKDGYPPETCYPIELGADWNRVVSQAVAEFANQRAAQVLDDEHGIPSDVPFTLVCAKCLDEGQVVYDDAVQSGWRRIEYVPQSSSANFLGICPSCQLDE